MSPIIERTNTTGGIVYGIRWTDETGVDRKRYSRAWSNEPRYGGSYAVYQPGQVTAHWQVLREPWGRVHLAGERGRLHRLPRHEFWLRASLSGP